MKNQTTNPHNPDGFSLIELIAVLVLLAVLAGVTLAGLSRKPASARLAAGAQAVTLADALARSHASSHRTTVSMSIDPHEPTIRLSCPTDQWSSSTLLPSSVQIASVTVASQAPTTSAVGILFSNPGWSSPYRVQLSTPAQGRQSQSITLDFNAFTGAATPTP